MLFDHNVWLKKCIGERNAKDNRKIVFAASRSGSVGVIHVIEEPSDLKWLEENGVAGPYTVVLPFSLFTRSTLLRLRATNNINGVLLAKNESQSLPMEYSPEDTCPNRYSGVKGCDEAEPWNSLGSSLLMEDWPFPMFYLQVSCRNNILQQKLLDH